jgi:hypothetical protein
MFAKPKNKIMSYQEFIESDLCEKMIREKKEIERREIMKRRDEYDREIQSHRNYILSNLQPT